MNSTRFLLLVAVATVGGLLFSGPRTEAAHGTAGVIATVGVGPAPRTVEVNPTTNRIYVANTGSDNVSVIDGATNAEIDTDGNPANGLTRVPVGDGPTGLGVNPMTNKIYVSNTTSNNVSVINGATNAVVATISTLPAEQLQQVGVNPNTNKIYVASNDPGGRVVKIDGATDTVDTLISVSANPRPVAVNPNTNKIYVGHGSFFGRTRITQIDGATNAVSDCTDVGLDHSAMALNPITDRIYLTRDNSNDVKVFDGACNPLIATIPVDAFGVGVNPNTNRLYLGNHFAGSGTTVTVINGATNAVVGNPITVGTDPISVTTNPSTDRVYVANTSSNTVSVIADDNDGDGIPDVDDPDDDNDGLLDANDGCPLRAEDFDGHQDADGCPDPDNDLDGVCDAGQTSVSCTGSDSGKTAFYPPDHNHTNPTIDCRNTAEDFDSFKDGDGCPEPDNDNDGFPDGADTCPGNDNLMGADGALGVGGDQNHDGILNPGPTPPAETWASAGTSGNDDSVQTFEDYDGILDTDGCHDSPCDDVDGDSFGSLNLGCPLFADEREAALGTNAVRACAATPAENDEAVDPWPLDTDDDGFVDTADIASLTGRFGLPGTGANVRYDLNLSGFIDTGDIALMTNRFGATCVPPGPLG